MKQLSEEMITRLSPPKDAHVLDLACGTGYITAKLAHLTGRRAIGVDSSQGMIKIAQKKYGKHCDFIQSEMIEYLTDQPSKQFDVITCAWGLGYSKPFRLIHEMYRVLKPGGSIGFIDLTTFSNWKMYWISLCVLAEKPEAVHYSVTTHYLPNRFAFQWRLMLNHFQIIDVWKGTKLLTFTAADDVKDQLKNTGSIAVFDSLITDTHKDWFYTRIAEEIQQQFVKNMAIPMMHNYIAIIGKKP